MSRRFSFSANSLGFGGAPGGGAGIAGVAVEGGSVDGAGAGGRSRRGGARSGGRRGDDGGGRRSRARGRSLGASREEHGEQQQRSDEDRACPSMSREQRASRSRHHVQALPCEAAVNLRVKGIVSRKAWGPRAAGRLARSFREQRLLRAVREHREELEAPRARRLKDEMATVGCPRRSLVVTGSRGEAAQIGTV